eukprot:TRINITY_DN12939_c0_g1_i1.p3 TRINITY_DN12939_c0_g1~~TRINITY_DN12939_c0_g1_i1.p3  ORF type:complete len:102 (-),score=17.42 TRINITY_DN12939_c0_g1_i1:69-374(-)
MTKGTTSKGPRHNKTHITCRRCGKTSYHIQKMRCASCGAGASAKLRTINWRHKAIRRRTTGTGRQQYLKTFATKYAGLKKVNNSYNQQVAAASKKQSTKLA